MTKNLARLKKICANVGMDSLYVTLFQNRFAQIHYSSQLGENGRKIPQTHVVPCILYECLHIARSYCDCSLAAMLSDS